MRIGAVKGAPISKGHAKMEAAEDSDSGDWEEALEKGILQNRRVFSGVFERIFQKYGREFDSDESGSEEIDLNSLHHEQFKETFEGVPRSFQPSQHPRAPSSSSSHMQLAVSDNESEPDPELAALLHRKVVKVKQEINWEEEEQRYQERRKEKLSHLSEDSDSEDEHQQSAPDSLHRTRKPVGLRRRFYFAKLKGSPENRPAITRDASQSGVETTLESTVWESGDDSEWPELNSAPEHVWVGNSPLSQAEESSRLSTLSHRDAPHTNKSQATSGIDDASVECEAGIPPSLCSPTSVESRLGHTESTEIAKHDSPPLCSLLPLPPPQSHSGVPQDGYCSGYDHQHRTVNSQSSESSTLDYIGTPPLIDRCVSRTPSPLIHSDHFDSNLSVVTDNGNSETSAVSGEDSGAEQKQHTGDKELPVSTMSRTAVCKTKSFHLKIRKLSLKRASVNQECPPTEVHNGAQMPHLEDSSHVTISATNHHTTTEAFLVSREATINCGPVSTPPVLVCENNPVLVSLPQFPANNAAFVSQTCKSEISSPYSACQHRGPHNTPQCCGYQNRSSLMLHAQAPCTHLTSYPQTALYHYEYPYLPSSCAPLQHCQLSPHPVETHSCCSCRNLQTEPNLMYTSTNLSCNSSFIGGVKRHMEVEEVHCNDANGPCAKRQCTFVQNHFYGEESYL